LKGNDVKDHYYQAVKESVEFLTLYSPNKPPRYMGAPSIELVEPELRVREALAEAQFILHKTADSVLGMRIRHLDKTHRNQKIVNMLHFVTASGFVLLIGDVFTTAIKWIGAAVSLVAGVAAIFIPKDLEPIRFSHTRRYFRIIIAVW
jgi:hypothetical protein